MRVLVVEDERELAAYVADGLRAEALAVDVSHDGAGARERLAVTEYDVVVLDRNLPDVPGDEICRELVSERPRTRVLMLTAQSSVTERVAGLNLGADDYLVKPFDFDELAARVRGLARRAVSAAPPVLERGGVVLDVAHRAAYRDGRALSLSPKEFGLLHALLTANGAVVSTEELLERVWDENADPFTSAVRVTMSKLRAKLGDPPVITTLPGSGYRIR
ncbi:response regulator transcription factor [Thermomonospora umbrina]|uniref:DNA-binding response OmpR family regulator n=1 Tax=Thermomonospora umbrina TaxID=111806 RepID=A0A3D9T000_9ACTN|nr:response regulator transcription factor [Thermomonospora umbrina]REE97171.1 DNA-binding response OmpR family regulator [Thermomonospora umbrina]